MMIRRGADWGEVVPTPPLVVAVPTDAGLAALIASGDPRPVRLVGGDLLATLGGSSSGRLLRRVPIDVMTVVADDRRITAVAHVVARGRIVVAGADRRRHERRAHRRVGRGAALPTPTTGNSTSSRWTRR